MDLRQHHSAGGEEGEEEKEEEEVEQDPGSEYVPDETQSDYSPPSVPALPAVAPAATPGPSLANYPPMLDSSLAFAMSYPPASNGFMYSDQQAPLPSPAIKRSFNNAFSAESVDASATLAESPRRTRHCCKCGSGQCKGKGGRSFCHNPCQDCGKRECPGRNSKRPDKTCAEAWRSGEVIS